MHTSLKQDGVSNDPGDVFKKIYELVWVHTKASLINNPTKSLFVGSSQCHWCDSFTHSITHRGLGRVCNMKVCALGSDLMWWQHILLSNSWPPRCPLCDQPLLPCFPHHISPTLKVGKLDTVTLKNYWWISDVTVVALFICSDGNQGNLFKVVVSVFFFISFFPWKDLTMRTLRTATSIQKGQTRGPSLDRESDVREEVKEGDRYFFTVCCLLLRDKTRVK